RRTFGGVSRGRAVRTGIQGDADRGEGDGADGSGRDDEAGISRTGQGGLFRRSATLRVLFCHCEARRAKAISRDRGGRGPLRSESALRLTPEIRQSKFPGDRKSTRLNSSHQIISYAVFCLKKKT